MSNIGDEIARLESALKSKDSQPLLESSSKGYGGLDKDTLSWQIQKLKLEQELKDTRWRADEARRNAEDAARTEAQERDQRQKDAAERNRMIVLGVVAAVLLEIALTLVGGAIALLGSPWPLGSLFLALQLVWLAAILASTAWTLWSTLDGMM